MCCYVGKGGLMSCIVIERGLMSLWCEGDRSDAFLCVEERSGVLNVMRGREVWGLNSHFFPYRSRPPTTLTLPYSRVIQPDIIYNSGP